MFCHRTYLLVRLKEAYDLGSTYRGSSVLTGCFGNPDAKRLYDDLLSNYNKLVRPVVNVTDPVTVRLKLKLSQLIDVVSPYVILTNFVSSNNNS